MEMQGIQDLATRKREQAKWKRKNARAISTDPRIAHEAEETADFLEKEADKLESQARDTQSHLPNIEMLIHTLLTSGYTSDQREKAIEHLEAANSCLRREIGYKPVDDEPNQEAGE